MNINRWPDISKPHIVTDSAFGSFKLAKEIQEWGGNITSSMPKERPKWLWNVLSHNVPTKHWRSAINEEGIMISYHIYEDSGKFSQKQIISTAFTFDPIEEIVYDEVPLSTGNIYINSTLKFEVTIPFMSSETLNGMTVENLRGVCKNYNIKEGFKYS